MQVPQCKANAAAATTPSAVTLLWLRGPHPGPHVYTIYAVIDLDVCRQLTPAKSALPQWTE